MSAEIPIIVIAMYLPQPPAPRIGGPGFLPATADVEEEGDADADADAEGDIVRPGDTTPLGAPDGLAMTAGLTLRPIAGSAKRATIAMAAKNEQTNVRTGFIGREC
jgi:hypothetical protein